ncbi:MAG: hypothetical protein GWO07_08995 [Candidatus Dadabacteria bacterium]|nr:hypothetical protein [Candidatus Dadabacteria bacterium]NIS08883.1 hypothetical protein [Candidatus Dadabacteria bacterium]NIV42582.1 hypothetical protein [Candidatus Dadabacteria bacterium]NIY22226.1 hypothetical protein [Candidatus Dadabacteria bacterium]
MKSIKLNHAIILSILSMLLTPQLSTAQAIVVQFLGTSDVSVQMIDTDGDGVDDVESNCYENDLVDPTSGEVVGTGLDCLRDIVANEDGSVTLISNIFFDFDGFGLISSEGTTTVQPLLTQSALDAGLTNGTGSFSDEDTIMFGTGVFENATGNVRLSGLVDLTSFPNEAFFNCVFEIAVDGDPAPNITGGGEEAIVVKFLGTATGEDTMIDTDGDGEDDVESTCFENDLVDPNTGNVVGHGIDCLRDITPVEDTNGLTLTSNIFFTFDDPGLPNGLISSEGTTTVQPLITDSALDAGLTHQTQSFSDDDTITFGTGDFAGATGNARLSGLVDLTTFPDDTFFNCMFIIRANRIVGVKSGSGCAIASNNYNAPSGIINYLMILIAPLLIIGIRRKYLASNY